MSLLHQAKFHTTVASVVQLNDPTVTEPLPEVAFVGRSNSGKSTAINLLCNQKRLAFASKTPGRTQHLNYFAISDRDRTWGYLVDLPGYGFSATGNDARAEWDALLGGYLRERSTLAGIVMMVDSRRGLTAMDHQLIDWVAPAERPIHVLLTKVDKLNRSDTQKAVGQVRATLEGSIHTVQPFSALKRLGIVEAEARVLEWLGVSVVVHQKNPGEQ